MSRRPRAPRGSRARCCGCGRASRRGAAARRRHRSRGSAWSCSSARRTGRSRRGGSRLPATRGASAGATTPARPSPVTGAPSSTTVSVWRYFARVVAASSGCESNASTAAARSTPDATARRSAGRRGRWSRGLLQAAGLASQALRRRLRRKHVVFTHDDVGAPPLCEPGGPIAHRFVGRGELEHAVEEHPAAA